MMKELKFKFIFILLKFLFLCTGILLSQDSLAGYKWMERKFTGTEPKVIAIVIKDIDYDSLSEVIVLSTVEIKGEIVRYISIYSLRLNADGSYDVFERQVLKVPKEAGALHFGDYIDDKGIEMIFYTADGVAYFGLDNVRNRYKNELKKLIFTPTFFFSAMDDELPIFLWNEVDLDNNKLSDLIIPGIDRYFIYYQTEKGKFTKMCELRNILADKEIEALHPAFEKIGQRDFFVYKNYLPIAYFENFNGDKNVDILFLRGGKLLYYLQDEMNDYPPEPTGEKELNFMKQKIGEKKVTFSNIKFYDIDGDRFTDMIVTNTSGNLGESDISLFKTINTELRIFRGGIRNSYTAPDMQTIIVGVSIDPQMADFNRDGRADIMVSAIRTDLFTNILSGGNVTVNYYIFIYDETIRGYRFETGADYDFSIDVSREEIEKAHSLPLISIEGDFNLDNLCDLFEIFGHHERPNMKVFTSRVGAKNPYTGKSTIKFSDKPLINIQLNKFPKSFVLSDLNNDSRTDIILRFTDKIEILLSSNR